MGHVYVLQFSDGTVKPGFSTSPESRLRSHRNAAACFGFCIERLWVSPDHHDAAENELALLAEARRTASAVRKAEYFTGLDFDALVEFAREMLARQGVKERPFRSELLKLQESCTGHARPREVDRLRRHDPDYDGLAWCR